MHWPFWPHGYRFLETGGWFTWAIGDFYHGNVSRYRYLPSGTCARPTVNNNDSWYLKDKKKCVEYSHEYTSLNYGTEHESLSTMEPKWVSWHTTHRLKAIMLTACFSFEQPINEVSWSHRQIPIFISRLNHFICHTLPHVTRCSWGNQRSILVRAQRVISLSLCLDQEIPHKSHFEMPAGNVSPALWSHVTVLWTEILSSEGVRRMEGWRPLNKWLNVWSSNYNARLNVALHLLISVILGAFFFM